jgi:hypothetical protein
VNSTRQIPAHISTDTGERLERYVLRHGVKKSHLIETAILHYLNSLEAIPTDVVIPPAIKVSRQTGTTILEAIENPPPATEAMRALFGG